MGMIDNIKKKFALSKIKGEAVLVSRQKAVFNIDDAKTIGILFKYTNNEDFELL